MKFIKKIFLTKKSRIVEENFLKQHADPHALTLEIGAKDRSNSVFFPHIQTVNRELHEGVDIIADMEDARGVIKDNSFEVVLCLSVLEHTQNPEKVISEIRRILKPGGRCLISVPFIMPLHDTPQDYWRFTKYGVELMFKNFEPIEIVENMDSLQTIGYMYHRLFVQTKVLKSRYLAVIFWIMSKFMYLFHWLITDEYGYVNLSRGEKHILSNNILAVFKKI